MKDHTVKKKRVVFHIGMPKCASTFLQSTIFPSVSELHFVKNHSLLKRPKNAETEDGFNLRNLQFARNIIDNSNSGIILFSSESFCGHPTEQSIFFDFLKLALMLEEYYDVLYILVIRRQDSFVESLYKHYVRKGGVLDYDSFFVKSGSIDDLEHSNKLNSGQVHFSYCDYTRFERIVTDDQGSIRPNTLVIPYEVLIDNSELFVSDILRFIGVKHAPKFDKAVVNRGVSVLEFRVFLSLSRLLKRGKKFHLMPTKVFLSLMLRISVFLSKNFNMETRILSSNQRKEILSMYYDSNRNLSNIIKYDISHYGYID